MKCPRCGRLGPNDKCCSVVVEFAQPKHEKFDVWSCRRRCCLSVISPLSLIVLNDKTQRSHDSVRDLEGRLRGRMSCQPCSTSSWRIATRASSALVALLWLPLREHGRNVYHAIRLLDWFDGARRLRRTTPQRLARVDDARRVVEERIRPKTPIDPRVKGDCP
jgi:hypothetical protein